MTPEQREALERAADFMDDEVTCCLGFHGSAVDAEEDPYYVRIVALARALREMAKDGVS